MTQSKVNPEDKDDSMKNL